MVRCGAVGERKRKWASAITIPACFAVSRRCGSMQTHALIHCQQNASALTKPTLGRPGLYQRCRASEHEVQKHTQAVRRACLHSEEMCVHCGSWNERWPAITMSTTSSSVLPLNGHAPASIVYTDTPIDHMSHWPENTARCETVYRAATEHGMLQHGTTCCNVPPASTLRSSICPTAACTRRRRLAYAKREAPAFHPTPRAAYPHPAQWRGPQRGGQGPACEAHCFGIRALEDFGRHVVH